MLDLERLQKHREDERVDRHQRQRVDQRPDEPEHGAAVLPVQLAAEDVHEQGPDTGRRRRTGSRRTSVVVRIVIDVTPLSHPRTGIGNYMLGMIGGLAEAGDAHQLAFFAPTGPRNIMRLRGALDGIPGDRRYVVPPPSNVWRKLWSRAQRGRSSG